MEHTSNLTGPSEITTIATTATTTRMASDSQSRVLGVGSAHQSGLLPWSLQGHYHRKELQRNGSDSRTEGDSDTGTTGTVRAGGSWSAAPARYQMTKWGQRGAGGRSMFWWMWMEEGGERRGLSSSWRRRTKLGAPTPCGGRRVTKAAFGHEYTVSKPSTRNTKWKQCTLNFSLKRS